MAKKVDEAFQVSENEVYACREKHEIIQAEALKREMETFHRRRILCMVEMFSKFDCSILFPGCIELNRLFYGELLFLVKTEVSLAERMAETTMIKIYRIWFNTDRADREGHYKITLFSRPRVSIHVDEYIWSFIEENIVKPHKLMRSEKHGYLLNLAFSLSRQSTDIFRFPHTTVRFGKELRWKAQKAAISARILQTLRNAPPGSLPIKSGQTAATKF